MGLLGKLLSLRDHPHFRRWNAGEGEPVSTLDVLQRLHDDVANAGVHMELGENSSVHARVNCIARTAIWRTNRVFEPVTEIDAGR